MTMIIDTTDLITLKTSDLHWVMVICWGLGIIIGNALTVYHVDTWLYDQTRELLRGVLK